MAFPPSCSKAFWNSDSTSGVALPNLAQLLNPRQLPLLVPPLQSSDSQACGENRKAQGPSPASIKSSLKLRWVAHYTVLSLTLQEAYSCSFTSAIEKLHDIRQVLSFLGPGFSIGK